MEVEEGKLILQRGGSFVLVGGKFPRLTGGNEKGLSVRNDRWLNEILGFVKSADK